MNNSSYVFFFINKVFNSTTIYRYKKLNVALFSKKNKRKISLILV